MTTEPSDRPAASSVSAATSDASLPSGQDPSQSSDEASAASRKKILIGSQRDPAAYRPKPIPVVGGESKAASPETEPQGPTAVETPEPKVETTRAPAEPVVSQAAAPSAAPPAEPVPPPVVVAVVEPVAAAPVVTPVAPPSPVAQESPVAAESAAVVSAASPRATVEAPVRTAAPRRSRGRKDEGEEEEESPRVLRASQPRTIIPPKKSQELDDELDAVFGDMTLEDLMTRGEGVSGQELLEPESQHAGRVVAVRREDVFIELGGREQGVVPLRQMDEPPNPGDILQVVVQRFNPDEGLYELSVPHAAASVGDWADLKEGMVVEAHVTGHNTGGLECDVNHIRGFIPVSQISLFRVDNMAEFVDQRFLCVVVEANPQRRNLVLSRRAMLEREKEDAKQKLMASLEVGQVHEGVVRKLMDFGAFVDIGGVDGLLHISQLSWARVKHPSEVLAEGQRIQVRIAKIDPATGKIGFGYREMMENPWTQAARKYSPNSVVTGTVTKIMEFGAFVQVEPGIEGLVHISELSHRRVWRATDVVSEGQQVEAIVLSVDADAQRMSLSMKLLAPKPETAKKEDEGPAEAAPPPPAARKKPSAPLKGGLGTSAGGDQFGLKW